jgi:hypothetical protein
VEPRQVVSDKAPRRKLTLLKSEFSLPEEFNSVATQTLSGTVREPSRRSQFFLSFVIDAPRLHSML